VSGKVETQIPAGALWLWQMCHKYWSGQSLTSLAASTTPAKG